MKCIILSGATVPFRTLIKAVDTNLVSLLHKLGYTEVSVQYGHAGQDFTPSPGVTGFDFDPNIRNHVEDANLVITHAGAGSLLDSLERGLGQSHRKIIVVINAELMNNHQTELAYKLKELGCVMVVENLANLVDAIMASSNRTFNQLEPPRSLNPVLNELMS